MAKKPIKPPKRQPLAANTERALKLVARGYTRYAAAKEAGCALSTIYRAVDRLKEAEVVRAKSR